MLSVFPAPPGPSISLGPLELRAYGLFIALGVVAAVWLMGRRLAQRGLGTSDDATSIALWAVGAGLIGARLYHVITDWSRFDDDLSAIPMIWKGGLGIPGGLILGIPVGLWAAKRRGISPAAAATCAAPAIPLAQAIGRWGNWFNQELYGRQTDLPWALEVDEPYLPAGVEVGATFHPTFLYESLYLFALVLVLLWIDRRYDPGPGRLMGVYVLGYGIGRFFIEGLRIDRANEILGLRHNQWMSLAAIIGAVVYLWLSRGRQWPTPSLDPAGGSGDDSVGASVDGPDAEPEDDPSEESEEVVERADQ